MSLTGVVAGLPQPFERGVRFDFDVERVEPAAARLPRRIALAWYNGASREEFQDIAPIRAGERWRFTVRLRRPHGSVNPHGFDYESWLLQRGIGATGYVRPRGERDAPGRSGAAPGLSRSSARAKSCANATGTRCPSTPTPGVLIALAIGDQNAIEARQWQLFARTGVSHLMSISGLHVTMVAGLFAALVHWLWRRSSALMLALPARKAAALAGFLAALGYCLIAGFAVPAQRTLYMVGVVALALWLGRVQSVVARACARAAAGAAARSLGGASPGFWLSFGAVAVILYVGVGSTGCATAHWLARNGGACSGRSRSGSRRCCWCCSSRCRWCRRWPTRWRFRW